MTADDGAQRVKLQQQHPARCDPGRALGQRPALVRGVHQAKAVDDHVGLPARIGGYEPASGRQVQPGPAVRAAVLVDHSLVRQPPCRADSFYRVGGLSDERGGLGPPRLFGHGGIGQQLG